MEVLQVKNISKQYGTKENAVHALKGISFTVSQGEFAAVVGTSGSGKSTLLNLIGGLDVPSQGEIIIRKHNIAGLKRKELTVFRRRNIGFVFQNYSLMPVLTVYDNVALPVTFDRGKHVDHAYIEELLKELGLWEKRKRYPNELSGGQKQRTALARALANKPAVILADEPTGNLDSRTTLEVMGLLKNSCKKYHQTILMVTHNESLAGNCDRILHIEDGRLVSEKENVAGAGSDYDRKLLTGNGRSASEKENPAGVSRDYDRIIPGNGRLVSEKENPSGNGTMVNVRNDLTENGREHDRLDLKEDRALQWEKAGAL